MKTIHESGIDFGPYQEENLFPIETSKLYAALGDGLKTTEFVLRQNRNVIFVEAKTNAPNPENRDSSTEKRRRFEQFYTEVPDKFVDSLGVYTAALLKRYADISEIGANLRPSDLADAKIIFALIITNPAAQIDWLPPMKAELEHRLSRWLKIWNVEVVVCNQELARRFGLLQKVAT